jgi:hypothetical protein
MGKIEADIDVAEAHVLFVKAVFEIAEPGIEQAEADMR